MCQLWECCVCPSRYSSTSSTTIREAQRCRSGRRRRRASKTGIRRRTIPTLTRRQRRRCLPRAIGLPLRDRQRCRVQRRQRWPRRQATTSRRTPRRRPARRRQRQSTTRPVGEQTSRLTRLPSCQMPPPQNIVGQFAPRKGAASFPDRGSYEYDKMRVRLWFYCV